jgi:hypothetical protein
MDFTDGIEKIRGTKSGEFERIYNAPQGVHSVTPGSPGKLEVFLRLYFFILSMASTLLQG